MLLFAIIFFLIFYFLARPKKQPVTTPKDLEIRKELLSKIEKVNNDRIIDMHLDDMGITVLPDNKG